MRCRAAKDALGDADYQGVAKCPENACTALVWHSAMRPSMRKALKKNPLCRLKEKVEKSARIDLFDADSGLDATENANLI